MWLELSVCSVQLVSFAALMSFVVLLSIYGPTTSLATAVLDLGVKRNYSSKSSSTWLLLLEYVDEMAGSGTPRCVVTIIIYHCDVAEALSSAGSTHFG